MYENDLAQASNWTGIVEDIDDPLMNNRLRIRINGFHNVNKTILPTDCLPWTMVGLVRENFGVAVLTTSVLPLIRLIKLEARPLVSPSVARTLVLIKAQGRKLDPLAASFSKRLLQMARNNAST